MTNANNDYRFIFSSLTRIADISEGFRVEKLPRKEWENGDYLVAEVSKIGGSKVRAELCNGRMMELMQGDLVVGALGVRHATLEATGTWEAVGDDGKMQLLTGAGVLGKMTSRSAYITPLIDMEYRGHVFTNGEKSNMRDYAVEVTPREFDIPVILFVGTSMSAGKTTSARIVTRQLKQMGLRVTGAKLTGAGRLRDILSIKDAGADKVYDFVDAGLPSSICPREQYKEALQKILYLIAHSEPDVAVIEIGASPLEPYNGDIAIEAIGDHVKLSALCASDPYAVLGVMKSFDFVPTIASGPAANTLGGVELIKKLAGVESLNLIERRNLPALRKLLAEKLMPLITKV